MLVLRLRSNLIASRQQT